MEVHQSPQHHVARLIVYIDLHTRNLVLNIPAIDSLTEEQFIRQLKYPECGAVISLDGEPLDSGLPEYLVWPSHFPTDRASDSYSIRLVDFGESFQRSDIPRTLRTPLVVRAPEVLFGDQLNYCVDLWSMGCMVSPFSTWAFVSRSKVDIRCSSSFTDYWHSFLS